MKTISKHKQRETLFTNINKAVKWKDYKFALHLVDQLIDLDPGDIAAYLTRVDIYRKQGNNEEAKGNLQQALKLAREAWEENEIEQEYYAIEEMESELDGFFDKNEAEKRRLERFTEYAYGLLYFIGAAQFADLKMLVEDITDLRLDVNQEIFAASVEQDTRFKVVGVRPMIVSLSEVSDPQKLVREFHEQSLDYAEFLIDDLVGSREVWAELFFDQPELEALDTLRKLTGTDFIVEKLHMMFNQEEDSSGAFVTMLFERAPLPKSPEQLREITDMIMRLWDGWPRWELGGNTPQEISEMEREFLMDDGDVDDDCDDDWDDKPQRPVRVVKIGRNEPCLCGSGKKYKKCCGMN